MTRKGNLLQISLKIVSFLLFLICSYLYVKSNIKINCLFFEITGLYCPGCGITRLFESLFKGHLYQAFRFNQLIFILLFTLPIYFIFMDKLDRKVRKNFLYCLLIFTFLFWILRNVSFFSFLQPINLESIL